jgi:hypothetical protein
MLSKPLLTTMELPTAETAVARARIEAAKVERMLKVLMVETV